MTYNQYDSARRRSAIIAALVAALAIASAIALTASIAPVNAETPAQRCKRETTAYNNAWKHTWAQANPGKELSDAPKPPIPYRCGGGTGPAPTLPPSSSDSPSAPTTSSPPTDTPSERSGPTLTPPTSRHDKASGLDPNQPPIEGSDSLDSLIGKPMRYFFADSLAEAERIFEEMRHNSAAGVEFGPCILEPRNVHVRTKTRDKDARTIGFKPFTHCNYPVDMIKHRSRMYYSYYTNWLSMGLLNGNPTTSVNYHQATLEQKNVEFHCNGLVGTSFKGETIGEIHIPGRARPMYAKVITDEFSERCEV